MPKDKGKRVDSGAIHEDGRIPGGVARSEGVGEERKMVFSFEQYNASQCEIGDLTKQEVGRLTSKLQSISGYTMREFNRSHVRDRVQKVGKYAPLYNTVPEGSKVVEIRYSDSGRIFGYIAQNVFAIVAICKKHK